MGKFKYFGENGAAEIVATSRSTACARGDHGIQGAMLFIEINELCTAFEASFRCDAARISMQRVLPSRMCFGLNRPRHCAGAALLTTCHISTMTRGLCRGSLVAS